MFGPATTNGRLSMVPLIEPVMPPRTFKEPVKTTSELFGVVLGDTTNVLALVFELPEATKKVPIDPTVALSFIRSGEARKTGPNAEVSFPTVPVHKLITPPFEATKPPPSIINKLFVTTVGVVINNAPEFGLFVCSAGMSVLEPLIIEAVIGPRTLKELETTTSPPKAVFAVEDPETNKKTSEPGSGNVFPPCKFVVLEDG